MPIYILQKGKREAGKIEKGKRKKGQPKTKEKQKKKNKKGKNQEKGTGKWDSMYRHQWALKNRIC